MTGAADHKNVSLHDLKWSPSEKRIARKAFDLALGRELEEIVEQTKEKVAKITKPSELWELESWLSKRRSDIDRDYDYRYSMLVYIFARLIVQGRLQEDALRGLGEDKLAHIRRITSL